MPEISLTSRSPTDILISWLPIPAKFRRGRIIAYRIHYRKSTERAVHLVELPGAISDHLLEDVEPDSTYLVRISAATKIGWGESSIWTSHRTPKATSVKGNPLCWRKRREISGFPTCSHFINNLRHRFYHLSSWVLNLVIFKIQIYNDRIFWQSAMLCMV